MTSLWFKLSILHSPWIISLFWFIQSKSVSLCRSLYTELPQRHLNKSFVMQLFSHFSVSSCKQAVLHLCTSASNSNRISSPAPCLLTNPSLVKWDRSHESNKEQSQPLPSLSRHEISNANIYAHLRAPWVHSIMAPHAIISHRTIRIQGEIFSCSIIELCGWRDKTRASKWDGEKNPQK